ncbi:zinc finger protein 415-like [Anoplophora glabripennis]|uniref:zinc finger protein 415-like n=1 Tax=Anoplophora glabripennis TaxID=217634 RepID=UPI000C793F55|nr:zinc finger protein 415-like [Anoplophora glabripennis]
MADVKETSCSLCLKNITDESFEVVDNIIRDNLDVLLLKLKFDSESKQVICNVCRRKLSKASEFKTTCLNTDNTIMLYVDNEKMLQLDLREVYMQEKKSELVYSQKICRLCMHPVESGFRCIRELELEAIEKLVPEMNINIVKDPVVCKPCFDSLCTHNSFLKDCSEVEEKIISIFGSSATGNQIDTSPLDLFVKTENLDKEFDINEMEMSIKAEYVDIKSEDEERSDMPLESSNVVPFEESDCKYEEEDGCKHENASEVKTKQEGKVSYKCNKCIYKTESGICFTAHCARHDNDLEAYKCESCDYKTENEKLLQSHLMKHKDPLQIPIYKCTDCDYESKYKSHIKQHQLKHKDPSQVQMYKCNDCDFETKYKLNMKTHQVKHKDPSQVYRLRFQNCMQEVYQTSPTET